MPNLLLRDVSGLDLLLSLFVLATGVASCRSLHRRPGLGVGRFGFCIVQFRVCRGWHCAPRPLGES